MESEFIAIEFAGQETEWPRSLLANIPLWGIHLDNFHALRVISRNRVTSNQAYNGNRRYIRLRHAIVEKSN